MSNKIFTAEMFTATKWDTAQDKADFANKFVSFVESGFKETLFTKKFYTRLSNCFGHIASYNKLGFYDKWFSDFDSQVRFLNNALTHPSFGDASYTYSDVERALKMIITNRQMISGITTRMIMEKLMR